MSDKDNIWEEKLAQKIGPIVETNFLLDVIEKVAYGTESWEKIVKNLTDKLKEKGLSEKSKGQAVKRWKDLTKPKNPTGKRKSTNAGKGACLREDR